MSKDIFLCDFNDSFVYNVYSLLNKRDFKVHLIQSDDLEDLVTREDNIAIVYGPGPGHPSQYKMRMILQKLLAKNNIFHLGICLGHQILCEQFGAQIKKAKRIMHGDSEELSLPSNWKNYFSSQQQKFSIQRYNSLAVLFDQYQEQKILNEGVMLLKNNQQEVVLFSNKNILSMQFHPDSIGTTYPDIFLNPLFEFLVN